MTERCHASPSAARSLILGLAAFLSIGLLADQPVRAQPAKFTYKTIYSFGSSGADDGTNPEAGLIDVDGLLYGTTFAGGKFNLGTLFAMTPDGEEVAVYSFPGGADGAGPEANLTYAFGSLYGTTVNGGHREIGGKPEENFGTVFKAGLVDNSKLSVQTLLTFGGGTDSGDGRYPLAPLTSLGGLLYGTTYYGGSVFVDPPGVWVPVNQGVVYAMTPDGVEELVHTFNDQNKTDGFNPAAGLIEVGGELWGTTTGGCEAGWGTVYKISKAGENVECSFHNSPDGAGPAAGLTELGGVLYGTTKDGGKFGKGTIFSIPISPPRCQTVLHSFGGTGDGQFPLAGLTVLGDTLYGTTFNGGKYGEGSVFAWTPKTATTGSYALLHSFPLVCLKGHCDGKEPQAGLTAVGNTLYGTASEAGNHGKGAVFAISFGPGACVISLAPTGQDGVLASGATVVDALNCNLYDNSSDPEALEAIGSAKIEVKNAYIAGNYNATLVTSSSCPGAGILCVPAPGVAKTGATLPSPLDPYCNYPTDTPPACANRTTPTEAASTVANNINTNPPPTSPTNDPTNPNFTVYNGNWGNNAAFYLTTAAASATGSTTLTFSAAAIGGLVVGMQVSKDTPNNAINGNPTITAVNTANDTVTISNKVQSPGVGNGDTIEFQIPSGLAITIYPGTYCGNIQPGGPLTLSSGVYILAGGSFDDQGGSSSDPVLTNGVCSSPDGKPYVNASGVTVYLGPPEAAGQSSSYGDINVSSCLSISAPTTGSTAGLAFWQDARSPSTTQDSITVGGNVDIVGAV